MMEYAILQYGHTRVACYPWYRSSGNIAIAIAAIAIPVEVDLWIAGWASKRVRTWHVYIVYSYRIADATDIRHSHSERKQKVLGRGPNYTQGVCDCYILSDHDGLSQVFL